MKKLDKVVRLTKGQLLALLSEFRKNISATGVAFGNIVYFVDEGGSKTANKQKVLQKFVRTNITLGADYEKRINRDLTKQGEVANFTAQAKSGMEYINDEGIICIDLKTRLKHYVVGSVEHHTTPDTIYFHEGKRISKAQAIEKELFMPSYFAPKETSGRGNMSEEKDFRTINPNIDNVISLTLNKVKYIVQA